jgi:hypothetical protein
MIYSFCFILLSIIPRDNVYRESTDLVEINHFYDDHGRLVFDQIIFYDWYYTLHVPAYQDRLPSSLSVNRFQVRAWRLLKVEGQLPREDAEGIYHSVWFDADQFRHIYSKAFKETWTQYDPELSEREWLPKELRVELKQVLKKK